MSAPKVNMESQDWNHLEEAIDGGYSGTIDKEYLQERLISSTLFLETVLDFLLQWADGRYREWQGHLQQDLLKYTSHEETHTRHDLRHHKTLHVLIQALGEAFKYHARTNSDWWRSWEPVLRCTNEQGLLLLALQAYSENIPENLAGITAQLRDSHLLRYSQLQYELGQLLNKAAYDLHVHGTLPQCESAILSIYSDVGRDDWVETKRAELLSWIPGTLCSQDVRSLVAEYRMKKLGHFRPAPQIMAWSGRVGSPLTTQQLDALSSSEIHRLLSHYQAKDRSEYLEGRGLMGGVESIQRTIDDAAVRNPLRYLSLLGSLRGSPLHALYAPSILSGIAGHLRRRDGSLNKHEIIDYVTPLPDAEWLASRLLQYAHSLDFTKETLHTHADIIAACVEELTHPVDVWMLLQHLEKVWGLILKKTRSLSEERSIALHAEDHVVMSMYRLWYALHDAKHPMPTKLERLLEDVAKGPDLPCRRSLLEGLPYIMQEAPGFGWRLLELSLSNAPGPLYASAEHCFYYNYHKHFSKVKEYLDTISISFMDTAGETWGRIMALASFSDHVDQEELHDFLDQAPQPAWNGAAGVFARNLDHTLCGPTCLQGLERLLQSPYAQALHGHIDDAFSHDQNATRISAQLAKQFIALHPSRGQPFNGRDFLEWLPRRAKVDPEDALSLLEDLAALLEANPSLILHSDHVFSTLRLLLNEAVEADDETFLRRVLTVMDELSATRVSGFDDFIENAGSRD